MGYPPGTLDKAARIFDSGAGYSQLKVPSKRVRFRRVMRPTTALDAMLKLLRQCLERELSFSPQDCLHGCVKKRGILSNARVHLGQKVVLRLDIRRFFESISLQQVKSALQAGGLDEDSALLLGRCTTLDGHLPVGFSTSPFLANLVFDPTDSVLRSFALEHSLNYTRYVDDLTFSGNYIDDEIRIQIESLIEAHGWTIQNKKTRFMRAGHAQYVTGLSVNDPSGPHIPRHVKRFLRLEIHHVAVSGFAASSLGKRKLLGHINNVKHVNPDLGSELHAALKATGLLTGRREGEDEGLEEYFDDELFWEELGVSDEF